MAVESTVERLHFIVERLNDGEKGYSYAGNTVENVLLRMWLFERAKERSEFATQLNLHLAKLGGDPEGKGTFLGALHRQWLAFKAEFIDNADTISEHVLEECVNGEKETIEDYNKILDGHTFSEEITTLLNEQRSQIERSYERIKEIEAQIKED